MIQEEILRISGLRPYNIRALDRITTEENGLHNMGQSRKKVSVVRCPYEVQSNKVIVSLARVKFHGHAPWVPGKIWKFSAQSHGGEPDEYWGLYTGRSQEVCLCIS